MEAFKRRWKGGRAEEILLLIREWGQRVQHDLICENLVAIEGIRVDDAKFIEQPNLHLWEFLLLQRKVEIRKCQQSIRIGIDIPRLIVCECKYQFCSHRLTADGLQRRPGRTDKIADSQDVESLIIKDAT